MMILMGVLVMILGVVGMIWGDRVLTKNKGGLAVFFQYPSGWAKYLKWPIGASIFFIGFITMVLGFLGWGGG